MIGMNRAFSRFSLAAYYKFAVNPWTVLVCVLLGAAFGHFVPGPAAVFGAISNVYLSLLTMVALPFMVSAIIFSLLQLHRDIDASKLISKILTAFGIFSLVGVALVVLVTSTLQPGTDISEDTRLALGEIVDGDSGNGDLRMRLFTPDPVEEAVSLGTFVSNLVPRNVFAALAAGDSLKVLVFALLFGMAAGKAPARVSDALSATLDTVFRACQTLTRWINYPLPFVLFMIAAQAVSRHGLEPFRVMASFVGTLAVSAALLIGLAILIIRLRTGFPVRRVVGALREAFAIAIATNNTASCMPAITEGLTDRLGFNRLRVELLVPLTTSLLRIGVMTYILSGTMFIAGLYGIKLSIMEISLLMLVSAFAGFASLGMSGLVTIQLLGTSAGMLGLPFEAAYILFAAVDPLCAMFRTAITVMTAAAAVTLIDERPALALAGGSEQQEA